MSLAGWLPVRVDWEQTTPVVEWILPGDERFTQPYFADTVARCLRHPFNHAFRRRTSIEELERWHAESPGLPPAGFIFHMSRCGAAVVGRMLAAAGSNLVLSEAPPLDAVLRAHRLRPGLAEEQQVNWLRAMLSALGQKRFAPEARVFVTFDVWNITDFRLIQQAFPAVPWAFLFRDPLDVLTSHLAQPAAWSAPGVLKPSELGFDVTDLSDAPQAQYCACLLAQVCRLALDSHRGFPGWLVNHAKLPGVFPGELSKHFNWQCSDGDQRLMLLQAEQDARSPGAYVNVEKHLEPPGGAPRVRELAASWLEPLYAELLAAEQTYSTNATISVYQS